MQNGFIESFNGRLRNECLNETLFTSLPHARKVLAAWKHDYNTVRPHSKLGGKTPAEIAAKAGWGQAPTQLAIPSNINHERQTLYLGMVTFRRARHDACNTQRQRCDT